MTDDQFYKKFAKGLGPWGAVLNATEILNDVDPTVSDIFLDLCMHPNRAQLYSVETVERMYLTIKLIELNRKVRVIGYVLYFIMIIKKRLRWWGLL
ncbi:MAG: hypothetical protein ACLFR1_12675 [Spirochaetia bacterium]